MRALPRALAALCILALALPGVGCGRYGPPRRSQPASSETGIEIQKKGGTAPETPVPSEEPKEEEEEPEAR